MNDENVVRDKAGAKLHKLLMKSKPIKRKFGNCVGCKKRAKQLDDFHRRVEEVFGANQGDL